MLDVVAIGELLIDFTCKTQDAHGYPVLESHPGGAPANFLAAMAKLGAKTALLGKVGNDTFGRLLISALKNADISAEGMIIDDRFFTTLAFVTLDAAGDREFSFARKPGADSSICADELNLSLIEEGRVFHFGTFSLTDEPAASATKHAVAFAKSRNKLITFDPNLRKPLWNDLKNARSQMLWGLEQADVVKISQEEVEFLFGLTGLEGAQHIFSQYPARLVFVTCGEEGCYFINRNAHGHVPALKGIYVIDTTGAGDIFGGTAIWTMLQLDKQPEDLCESELQHIARIATAAAGLSTTRFGGISSVPEYAEIQQALRSMS